MLFVFVLLLGLSLGSHARIWETIYLDQTEHCDRLIRNDHMSQGDTYVVMSDTADGDAHWVRRPAECAIGFNFGDRHVSIHVERWWCQDDRREPFIAVYENCEGLRSNPLERINCSTANVLIPAILSRGSCISLYHYRGHTKAGYFFKLLITAEHEIIAFPAGGVAAALVCCILAIMLLVKFVCVITGYENRLPLLNLDPEEEREIIGSTTLAIQSARQRYNMPLDVQPESLASADNLLERDSRRCSAQIVATDTGHRVLRVTHSNGSGGRPSTSGSAGGAAAAATTTEFDYDFVNAQVVDRRSSAAVPPTLNRFPSFKGASIWRSK